MEKQALGIYIHSPYCLKKCKYCDFTSFAQEPDLGYFAQLIAEIEQFAGQYAEKYFVDTIFFGGGTPSLVDIKALHAVINAVKRHFEVIEDAEISIECNPETLNEEKLSGILDAGFNRLSIGVQSLNDPVLEALGRVHNADKVREVIKLIKAKNINFNIDLMLGLPKQTTEIFKKDFEEVLSWNPNHISFYSLQLEEKTVLYKEYQDGLVELPTWEENRQMYQDALDMLKAAGYHHYEISNAALPGYECKHNLKYWNMQPYLGFGLGAHSFIEGYRLERTVDELLGTPQTEEELKGDFIFTKLRLIDGFKLKDYKEMFNSSFLQEYKDVLAGLFEEDLLEQTSDGVLKLTRKGLDNTNPVMERLLNV
ncbi:MAG: radical SAM family heme chaperone HemW [Clostridia bacterium]|nr:radical SAM family heme chaperone HemW [Clostridia bacterium]